MTHTVTVAFLTEESEADILYWISQIEDVLPIEIEVSSKRDARSVNAADLKEDDLGSHVIFVTDKDGRVQGVLEAIYTNGTRNGDSRVLVVNGAAYTINYGVVQVAGE